MARDRDFYQDDNQDLVVPHGMYANLLNTTSGGVDVVVGPQSVSPSATDYPVTWDSRNKTFERCSQDQARMKFFTATEGQYIVLTNPASGGQDHPGENARQKAVDLHQGRKVNISGPISFALWPGQEAEIVEGHHLRSNQFILVRVYNDDAAMKSWGQAVVKVNTDDDTSSASSSDSETVSEATVDVTTAEVPTLTMGQLMIIKGTDVSFYIPPTGIEVVVDEHGQHVRDAETLENLEFCILLDQNGSKRYVIGPDVVFPEPTETFVSQGRSRKGRAIELNEISGIYVKVIETYTEDGAEYKAGTELFITGADTSIYYPRQEHSIIKYGDQVIHYATAIPEGEGRYVLNRDTGVVRIEEGPSMFLPDPRHEVIVRRILNDMDCNLLYPGNHEALTYNRGLTEAGQMNADAVPMASMALSEDVTDFADDMRTLGGGAMRGRAAAASYSTSMKNAAEEFIGAGLETTQRKRQRTRPRTLTLDTKYDGVVTVDVHNGYAALFTRKNGDRQVVVGPKTVLLQYDERPHGIQLSKGEHKTNDHKITTGYLRVKNNRVGDCITVETKDSFDARLWVRYAVNFTGDDATSWFDVENYVLFLCERMRSIIRRECKKHTVTELKDNAIDIIRNLVLGAPDEDNDNRRPGRLFEENGMHVFDIDVSTPEIDHGIDSNLRDAERKSLIQKLTLEEKQRELAFQQELEQIEQSLIDSKAATAAKRQTNALQELQDAVALSTKQAQNQIDVEKLRDNARLDAQATLDSISTHENERIQKSNEVTLALARAQAQIASDKLKEQAAAISPELASAIQRLGDEAVIERIAESMAPLSILGGDTVMDVVKGMLGGTKFENMLDRLNPSALVSSEGRDDRFR